MKRQEKALFQLPQGAKNLALGNAAIHRRITERITRSLAKWGYAPIETPVIDFYDIYNHVINSDEEHQIYRLFDREGNLLALRSDITLFLAKQLGLSVRTEDLPCRLFYADSILRHQDKEAPESNEFYQLGAELVGKSDSHADLEILHLALASIQSVYSAEIYLHLGSRKFFRLISSFLSREDEKKLRKAVLNRDKKGFQKILSSNNAQDDRITALSELCFFIGNTDQARKLISTPGIKASISSVEEAEISYLLNLAEALGKSGHQERVRIDFSEIGTHAYYTGIAFQIYTKSVESAIASGGRYDDLLEHFGLNAPSVGFSFLPGKLVPSSIDRDIFTSPSPVEIQKDLTFQEKLSRITELQEKGKTTIIV
ncbi:MAG: ATP phosphoribosyltransferase regulatory subunit [Spirochaetia bacterium]